MAYAGLRLRAAREARKLTQDQLAALTGIRRTDISAIETNDKPLGPKRARVLADALEISVLELLPEAEADLLGLVLQDRQAELEAQVLKLTESVTRLTRRVRALERQAPPGSPGSRRAAK